ncbi:hypothetical protein [Granulicella mallensis]|uniref:Glycosyltransferase RgtA/B/C/D-like domain-containing protein n=1 Tax=Granulicella mallensis TaxID=940614 RepID=A0A7W8ECB0_9BACT|nr:hypothetical protein [Granulicella mallensis]MBB5065420.1 hypothetical protein [Granulicella mallensis]
MEQVTSPHRAGPLSRPLLLVSFAGALLFLYLRTFLLPGTPYLAQGDQILFFARAVRVAHGQVLYRDFFELVTPGTDLLYAAAFRVFGIHAWVMQAWTIVLGLALFWVVLQISGRIFRGPLVLLPALLFLIFDFNSGLDATHHWYSTLTALMAVLVLMRGASLWRIVAAGALCGIATLFTQTQGALVFAALIVYLLWLWRSDEQGDRILVRLSALTLPFVLIVTSVLGYYVCKAGLHTVFFDLVLVPVRYMSSGDVNSPRTYLRQIPSVHSFPEIVRLPPVLFIYAVVPYVYFFGLYKLWRKRTEPVDAIWRHLVLLHLAGLALFLSVASAPRLFRLSTVAPPAIIVLVWLLDQQRPLLRAVRNTLAVVAVAYSLFLTAYRQTHQRSTLTLPLGRTAFTDVQEFHAFQWMSQHTHPSEGLFNQTSLGLYLALDNPAATEFIGDDGVTRPDQVAAALQAFRRDPPHFIVLIPESPESLKHENNSGPFREYVHRNYHLAQSFSFDRNSGHNELWELGRPGETTEPPMR